MSSLAYRYTGDDSITYQVVLPSDFAASLGYIPAIGTEPYLPSWISYRYATYRSATGLLINSVCIPVPYSLGEPPLNITVGGVAYVLKSFYGEQRGVPQIAGLFTISGPQGPPGTNGTNGVNGTNGTNGTNGANGTNGTNGTNGALGFSGTGIESGSFTAQNNFAYVCKASLTVTLPASPLDGEFILLMNPSSNTLTFSSVKNVYDVLYNTNISYVATTGLVFLIFSTAQNAWLASGSGLGF